MEQADGHGRCTDHRAGEQSHPAERGTAHEEHADEDRDEDQRRAQVRLSEDQEGWQRHQRRGTDDRRQAADPFAAPAQPRGEDHDHQHLADLAALEVEPGDGDRHLRAEQLRSGDHREQQQAQHREVQRQGQRLEPVVVDARDDEEDRDADAGPDQRLHRLRQRRPAHRVAVRRGVAHHHAERHEQRDVQEKLHVEAPPGARAGRRGEEARGSHGAHQFASTRLKSLGSSRRSTPRSK